MSLTLEPIGFVRTTHASKVEAPRQPQSAAGAPGRIELLPGRNFEHALEDLEGWDFVWVVFWFHLNEGWRPKVLPPRSTTGRKGVFATRAPHRPNPLGLSALRLERIEGLTVHVSDVDLVDGTPVLDIKPYVPYTDAHPLARTGWLEDAAFQPDAVSTGAVSGAPVDPVPAWRVEFSASAAAKATWVEAHTAVPLRARIEAALSMGPEPHAYRRIRRGTEGSTLAVKEWRVHFVIDSAASRVLRVVDIASGFRTSDLAAAPADDPIRKSHREFGAAWPPGRS